MWPARRRPGSIRPRGRPATPDSNSVSPASHPAITSSAHPPSGGTSAGSVELVAVREVAARLAKPVKFTSPSTRASASAPHNRSANPLLREACIRLTPPTGPARSQSSPSGVSGDVGDDELPAGLTQLGTPGLPLATAGASLHLASARACAAHAASSD